MGATWKTQFCNWIFLISLQPIPISESAVPIDIVTEIISVPKKIKGEPLLPLNLDKDPLIKRRFLWSTRPTTTTTKRYALYLKYYDSHYEEYYDMPFITIKPIYPVPGVEFGIQLAKAQVPPVLFKMAMGGGNRRPHPRGRFKPPRYIHIPEEIENYKYFNFHFNHGPGLQG